MAVLEDPHQRAERRGQRQEVARERLDRQQHAAGEQEQQHEGDRGHQPEDERKPFGHGVDAVAVDLRHPAHLDGPPGRSGDVVQPCELGVVRRGEQRRRAADGQKGAALGQPGRPGRWPHPISAREGAPGRGHGRHVGHARERGGVAVEIPGIQAGGIGDDDGHRRRGIVGEVVAQPVTDLVRRRRARQHPVVREPPLHREERQPEQQEQADDGQADRRPAAHHELARPIPEQLLDGLWRRLGSPQHPPQEPTHIERVQPVAQQHDRGGGDHDRGGGDEGDRGHPGVGERLEEVHREGHRRRHRQRHGDRGEQHRAAGGGHRPDQRLVAVVALGQFVAVAADDEQRVVDCQRQAQGGAEVEGEDRHLGGEGDQAQHRHRADDGKRAQRHRQRGGQQPTEHPDQHHEAQRQRDHLHHQQVVLVLLVDLGVLHGRAAGADGHPVAVVDELVRQGLRVVLDEVFAAFEVDHDEARLAVAAHEIGWGRAGPRRGHVVDQRGPLELVDEVGAHRAGLFAVGAAGGRHQDQHLLTALPELVGQHGDGAGGLRVRILEAAGRQALGDGNAEDGRGDENQHPDRDDPARRRDSDSGDFLQHCEPFRCRCPVALAAG